MDWLQSVFSGDNGSAPQLIAITILCLLIVILTFWLFRKIAGTAANRTARNRVRRLSVTDWTSVGEKHQLVLVRRDNVEHLILIGGNSDVVVEQNIVRTQAAAKSRQEIQPQPQAQSAVVEEVAETSNSNVGAAAAVTAGAAAATSAAAGEISETIVAPEPEPIIVEEVAPEEAPAEVAVEAPSVETNEVSVEAEVADATAVTDTVEFESDLINSITESLDEDVTEVTTAPTSETPSVTEAPTEQGQDEMQRLLDELANETKDVADAKEPA